MLDRDAQVQLLDIGIKDVSLEEAARIDLFSFAEGQSQGPDDWYGGRLHVRLDLDQILEAVSEPAYLTGEVNDASFGLIKLLPTSQGDLPGVVWSTADLFLGGRSGVTLGPSLDLSFENYLQRSAVRSGPASLGVRLETLSGGPPSWITGTLLPDSSVYRTTVGPPDSSISVDSIDFPDKVGEETSLTVSVESVGTRLRDVRVTFESPDGAYGIEPAQLLIPEVAEEVDVEVRIRRIAAEGSTLRVEASPENGGDETVVLRDKGRRLPLGVADSVLLIAGFVGVCFLLLIRLIVQRRDLHRIAW